MMKVFETTPRSWLLSSTFEQAVQPGVASGWFAFRSTLSLCSCASARLPSVLDRSLNAQTTPLRNFSRLLLASICIKGRFRLVRLCEVRMANLWRELAMGRPHFRLTVSGKCWKTCVNQSLAASADCQITGKVQITLNSEDVSKLIGDRVPMNQSSKRHYKATVGIEDIFFLTAARPN